MRINTARFSWFLLIIFFLSGIPPAADSGVTPSPSVSPSPSPTPLMIPVDFFFRRPAKIIPVHNKEDTFEIVQEVPWLTEQEFVSAEVFEHEGRPMIQVYLSKPGRWKYREAMAGNVGRAIILSISGTVRNVFRMVPVERKDRIHLVGDFSFEEARKIAQSINLRKTPTPSPAPLPTPGPRHRVIVE